MKQFIVTISDIEEKAILSYVVDIQEWLDNAIHDRARKAIDQAIEDNTDINFKKISLVDKEQLIHDMAIKTVVEKQAEMELLMI